MPPTRRDFLASSVAGAFILKAAPMAFAMATSSEAGAGVGPESRAAFPQGVGSADPQPDRVMLWTRLDNKHAGSASSIVTVQVSPNAAFDKVIVERKLPVNKAQDHTLRTIITGLEPRTDYYYRFITLDGVASRTGRTWTAPADDDEVPVTIMSASCQSYPPSKYGAYRHLIDSELSGRIRRPDLVLHLGDYIYGLTDEQSDRPPGTDSDGIKLTDPYELALEGTRRIYRAYLRDDDLQDARAMYPFACIWDDHEFANDPWESYIAGEGSRPQKRLAANQAWFEFVPQILSENRGLPGVANEAHDFRAAVVEDVPMKDFGDGFMSFEPNNFAAIQSLRTYRGVRWGRLVDILLTDNRIYRGPGANPGYSEAVIESGEGNVRAFSGFNLHDGKMLETLSRGREANNGNPPATVTIKGEEVPNPRKDSPAVSMLGVRQKDWFKHALNGSDAKWKVWANAMPVMGFRFDPGRIDPTRRNGFLWTDGWDGFPNEREELMKYIREMKIGNVVSLSGDRHAHYAGLVAENYTVDEPTYVIPDFTNAAVSAFSRGPFLARPLKRMGLGQLAEIEVTNAAGGKEKVSTLNFFMRKGAVATDVLAKTGDLQKALAAVDEPPNPHLVYADNDVHGYCIAHFHEDHMQCDFVSVARPEWDREKFPNGPGTLRVVPIRVDTWKGGEVPEMQRLPTIGEIPFGDKT
jgi:alkaline phosphatase D